MHHVSVSVWALVFAVLSEVQDALGSDFSSVDDKALMKAFEDEAVLNVYRGLKVSPTCNMGLPLEANHALPRPIRVTMAMALLFPHHLS